MATMPVYQRRGVLVRIAIALLAVALASWLWHRFLPLPPSEVTLSAGRAQGVYHNTALRYAELFALQGIKLQVVTSDGSEDNLRRLRGEVAPLAHFAFLQGGVSQPLGSHPSVTLRTIARVAVEPLWIFSRKPDLDSLQQFQGLRVALGTRGSGTRRLATLLLEQVRLSPADVIDSDLAGMAAAQALRQGTLDVVVMVALPDAPSVRLMMQSPGVHLVQLSRSAALIERLPWLQLRLMPQGVMGDQARMPARDLTLPVTTSSLVVREDVHPALQRLAASVAREVHAGPGPLHRAGEFPSLKRIEFPVSEPARAVLTRGLPWLERHLPFWWAQVALRVLVLCLPVALSALWLMELVPASLRWSAERRLARWYGELKYIEHDLARNLVSGIDMTRYLTQLDAMEQRVAGFAPPRDLRPRLFTLRQHIEFVRMGLIRKRGR